MNVRCPNSDCLFFQKQETIQRDGHYFRKNDSKKIQRFRCTHCKKRFSKSTKTLEYNQKKRRVNRPLLIMLCSGMSIRRSAMALQINKNTVLKKMIYLAEMARVKNSKFLELLKNNKVDHMQFDDLITSEHTKMKPLSVTIAVNVSTRHILGIATSQIPAFGLLAKKSVKKYGYRKSFHMKEANSLFRKIRDVISKTALIESDEHKRYPELVVKHFSACSYKRYKGEKGSVAGQGELKKVVYDPLFCINHTCAMLRANINRLIRKTWCTTKNPKMLQNHLDIFTYFYNQIYL